LYKQSDQINLVVTHNMSW